METWGMLTWIMGGNGTWHGVLFGMDTYQVMNGMCIPLCSWERRCQLHVSWYGSHLVQYVILTVEIQLLMWDTLYDKKSYKWPLHFLYLSWLDWILLEILLTFSYSFSRLWCHWGASTIGSCESQWSWWEHETLASPSDICVSSCQAFSSRICSRRHFEVHVTVLQATSFRHVTPNGRWGFS